MTAGFPESGEKTSAVKSNNAAIADNTVAQSSNAANFSF
jgi:hypothetical protein